MKPEEQLKAELEKAGLSVDEEVQQQLLPMYQRWQGYIRQAREIDVREVEPAHVFCPTQR